MDNNKKYKKKLKEHLEKYEGNVYAPYLDAVGKTTIGRGVNLDAPGAQELLEKAGLTDRQPSEFSPEEVDTLSDLALDEKLNIYKQIESKFNKSLPESKRKILQGMAYQNKNLIGPGLTSAVNRGDDRAVAEEILLRSNKAGIPGIQLRRIQEAAEYAGPAFSEVVKSLKTEDRDLIRNRLENIQNPNTKKEALDLYERYFNENMRSKDDDK